MTDVFMCYVEQDVVYARDIIEELFGRGIKVFDFSQDISPGSQWWDAIQQNISSSSVVIPIITSEASKSIWVQREIDLARRQKKLIFPLLLEGEMLPSLESIQYLDVTDGSLPGEGFFEIIDREIKRSKSLNAVNDELSKQGRQEAVEPNDPEYPKKDARLNFFVGRNDILHRTISTLRSGQNVLLYGPRRIGKTSVLLKLEEIFKKETNLTPIYFDAGDINKDLETTIIELSEKLASTIKNIEFSTDKLSRDNFFKQLEKYSKQLPDETSLVLLLDNRDAHFNDLRVDEFWKEFQSKNNTLLRFVVALRFPLENYSRSYVDTTWLMDGEIISLPFLSLRETVEQIEQLASLDASPLLGRKAIQQIWEYTGGHPYFTKALYEASCNRGSGKPITSEIVNLAAEDIIRRNSDLFSFLFDDIEKDERDIMLSLSPLTSEPTSLDSLNYFHQRAVREFADYGIIKIERGIVSFQSELVRRFFERERIKESEKTFFDIYISYNSRNKRGALEIASQLRSNGLKVWIDEWELSFERPWQNQVKNALKRTRKVLVLIGPDGIGPHGQSEELEYIYKLKHKLTVIPILLPDAPLAQIPKFLRETNYADLRSHFDSQFEKLLYALRTDDFDGLASHRSVREELQTLSKNIASDSDLSDFQLGVFFELLQDSVGSDTSMSRQQQKDANEEISSIAKETTQKRINQDDLTRRLYRLGETAPNFLKVLYATFGNIPLRGLELATSFPTSALTSLVEKIAEKAKKDIIPSKRVLNAGFEGPRGLIPPERSLAHQLNYDLVVDVGPRWDLIPSLVIKSAKNVFPEEFLHRKKQGYTVRVVFVSEDFTPNMFSAEMWIPVNSGQSHPIVDGRRLDTPEPIRLSVQTPKLSFHEKKQRAYGRLTLYYKGQVIQSASVSVGVAHMEGIKLDEPHKIEVDYVLSTDFGNLKELVERTIKLRKDSRDLSVAVNFTLNDDGSGRHRILATYHLDKRNETTLPPAWKPYDSNSASQELENFREVIAACYKGLDKNLGKNRKRFGRDLLRLAVLGDRLRSLAMSGLNVDEKSGSVALWERDFFHALEKSTVIQIARTGPANYVFPWALVYEYPMPGNLEAENKYELCPIIEEWDIRSGIRSRNFDNNSDQCPYHHEEWHAQNIICPYGFWGFKHIIEQPLGALYKKSDNWELNTAERIKGSPNVILGTGTTNDIDLDARDIHIQNLAQILYADLNPTKPANSRSSALEMLRSPEIAYFLCHGETEDDKTPYLSIGDHTDEDEYKILPSTIEQWSLTRTNGIDLSHWADARPLVFINACHSVDLKPGVVLNFVSAFSDLGASGVIGTEVSVRTDMAMEVAELVLGRIAAGDEIGQAVLAMRWEMLNRGNVLGLAYTPYSLANLALVRES
jgi:hypothetical protein